MATIKTTCPYCGVGCGVTATVESPTDKGAGGRTNIIAVEGSATHPANNGRLCVKGSALHETLSLEGRLLFPKIDGVQASWDQALTKVADSFKQTIAKHGPDSVAFYLSGQLLTEDYYVANKLMKGFIGSANVDTNSRLCMASAVAGYKRAFGSDTVPCNYEDLETCDLLVMIGSNAAWTHPVLYQRMVAAKAQRPEMRVVVIDPRETTSCDIADLHLAITPGSDASLFNGLLRYLSKQNALNQDYIDQHTEGFDAALEACDRWDIETTATDCGISESALSTFFGWYADTEKTLSFYSMGINQSSSGTDKCNAIINAHLATGRIGREGMGPFSITGQPNAMGGREVGGLANQLAAHMGFSECEIDRVRRFWKAEKMATTAGLLAVDLFDAMDRGEIKAVWVMATNPAVSLPNANLVQRALDKCDFVAVSDCAAETDTGAFADVLLPAMGWSEKEGTVTNSERRISVQQALTTAAGEARDDWWIICEVAKRMGWGSDFDYASARDIFVEHARLSAFENHGSRDFDIGGLANLSEQEFKNLQPIQWPVPASDSSGSSNKPRGTARMFTDNTFFTPSGRAQFIAIEPRKPMAAPSAEYPYTLNTGRIRDQWHSMTRTGKAQRLSNHIDAPYVGINPADASAHKIADEQIVELSNQYGRFHARASFDSGVQPQSLFVPMHWTGQNSSLGRVAAIVNPYTDPVSGQPESKQTPVTIAPLEFEFSGMLLIRDLENADMELGIRKFDIKDIDVDYWIKNRVDDGAAAAGYRYELAHNQSLDWRSLFESTFGDQAQFLEYRDIQNQITRIAVMVAGKIMAMAYQEKRRSNLPGSAWLSGLLQQDNINAVGLLSGRQEQDDSATRLKGRLICSCFAVGERQICAAIESGADSAEKLGDLLRCGTNCGSCIPELKQMIRHSDKTEQAA